MKSITNEALERSEQTIIELESLLTEVSNEVERLKGLIDSDVRLSEVDAIQFKNLNVLLLRARNLVIEGKVILGHTGKDIAASVGLTPAMISIIKKSF